MRKLVPVLATAAMLLGMSTTTYATEWMDCSDPTDHVQMGVLLGGIDFAEQSRTHLRVGEEWWSTDPTVEPGAKPINVVDYFFDWKEFSISVADVDYMAILAEMRLLITTSDDGDAKGGVLSIPGKGVWAVTCEGP